MKKSAFKVTLFFFIITLASCSGYELISENTMNSQRMSLDEGFSTLSQIRYMNTPLYLHLVKLGYKSNIDIQKTTELDISRGVEICSLSGLEFFVNLRSVILSRELARKVFSGETSLPRNLSIDNISSASFQFRASSQSRTILKIKELNLKLYEFLSHINLVSNEEIENCNSLDLSKIDDLETLAGLEYFVSIKKIKLSREAMSRMFKGKIFMPNNLKRVTFYSPSPDKSKK